MLLFKRENTAYEYKCQNCGGMSLDSLAIIILSVDNTPKLSLPSAVQLQSITEKRQVTLTIHTISWDKKFVFSLEFILWDEQSYFNEETKI